MSRWTRYYDAAGMTPRDTLLHALALFDAEGVSPGTAVDLGAGTGRDTFALLERGWNVIAIDATEEAMERLRSAASDTDRLTTRVARFEDAEWPQCELVNSSFALPFMPPPAFAGVWERVVGSLRPGGRFSGQLFGDRDGWVGADDITFHTLAETEALLDGFDVEELEEFDEDSETALGEPKHWHFFNIVARKH